MICDNCKNIIDDFLNDEMVCPYCHKELNNLQEEYTETEKNETSNKSEFSKRSSTPNIENNNITFVERTTPLSALSFFVMQILFFIPIINLLFLFIFSFKSNINKNRKSFARSVLFWHALICTALLAAIVAAITLRYPLDLDFWLKRLKELVNSIPSI